MYLPHFQVNLAPRWRVDSHGRDSGGQTVFGICIQAEVAILETLTTGEKARIIQLLIEQIDFDGGTGQMRIAFRDSGIEILTGAANKHDSMETDE